MGGPCQNVYARITKGIDYPANYVNIIEIFIGSAGMSTSPGDILKFWFEELTPARWWRADDALDRTILRRFAGCWEDAAAGRLDHWQDDALSCLALIIVLDQFSRNIHRGTPKAFAQDGKALAIAEHALARGFDRNVAPERRLFFYMPYEHAEDLAMQEKSVALFERLGKQEQTEYAIRHRDIVARFGRFPHRNAILGRKSSEEEEDFLAQPGSSF